MQVFISYGNNTNDHYLMVYGFALPNNPEEKYKLHDVNDKLLKYADVSLARLKYVNNTELTRKLKEVLNFLPLTLGKSCHAVFPMASCPIFSAGWQGCNHLAFISICPSLPWINFQSFACRAVSHG